MYCKKISVSHFRNISSAEVEFQEGVNILAGENAQGKTNLLEAIFYPSMGRSFRGAHAREMIEFGQDRAELILDFQDAKRLQSIRVKLFRNQQRQVEKNGVKVEKLTDIVGLFRAVLFCPEHLSMIKEGPLQRRNYMDMAISRMHPMYVYSLQKYNYLLKQRNALLKQAVWDRKTFDATIELWSSQLAKEAAIISAARLAFTRQVSEYVAECFAEMTGDREIPVVLYEGSAGQKEDYADKESTQKKYYQLFMSSHDREISMGATLWGIHKDDLNITLNGKSARIYGSQGQQRSLALAMKLAEGELTKKEFGDYPVFLLDDVLSELDHSRRDYLIHQMKDKQIILTGCEPNLLLRQEHVKQILVRNGTYQIQ